MKNVMEYLRNHPGARLREMLGYVGMNRAELAKTLCYLEEDGKVVSETYSDPANMEFYNKWYIADYQFSAKNN